MEWPSALYILLVVASCKGQNLVQHVCSSDKSSTSIGNNPNVLIGGLFEMRGPGENGFGCDQPIVDQMQVFKAAKFTITALNNGFIPGVQFGMQVYDTCKQSSVTLKALQQLYPQVTSSDPFCSQNDMVVLGAVGPMSSGTAITAARHAANIPASLISPRAMSPMLSDTMKFPTFLRTTPSNAVLGRVIAELLKSLQWEENVLLVYTDNAYGRSGYENVLRAAHTLGVCISRAVAVDPSISSKDAMKTALASVGNKVFGAGVVIAESRVSKLLLQAVDEMTSLTSTQWIFSDLDMTSDLSSLTRARGAMAVFPSSPAIDEFKTYFAQQQANLSPTAHLDNPWFNEWYEEKYNCKIGAASGGRPQCVARSQASFEASFVQSPWAVSTMKAIVAYAVAAERICTGSVPGQCVNRLRSTSPSDFFNALKNLDLTLPQTFPIVGLQGQRLRFDANGDPMSSDFTVYNYQSGSNSFSVIGDLTNNIFTLNTQPTLYTADRTTPLATNPTFACATPSGCINCLRPERAVTFRYTPGDLVIASLVNGHKAGRAPFTCGAGDSSGLAALVAAEWAVSEFGTRNPTKLQQVSLGSLAADVCPDGFVASSFLTDLLSGNNRLTSPSGTVIRPTNILGFVDQTDGSQTEVISPILASRMIPEIQTDSVPVMMDKSRHPYLIQAVPSDGMLHETIADFLIRLNWKYVKVVTHKSGMYQTSAQAFRMSAGRHGICVVDMVDILDSDDDTSFTSAVARLRSQQEVKIVVVIADMAASRKLFNAIATAGAGGELQLVAGTGKLANNPSYLDSQSERSGAEGIVTVGLEMGAAANFAAWLQGLTRAQLVVHPFLRELFELTNECFLGPSSQGKYNRACGAADNFNSILNSPVVMGKTPYVIQSVYTMAEKLHEVISELCGGPNYSGLCPNFRSATDIKARLDAKLQNTAKVAGFGIKNGMSTTDFIFYQYKLGTFNRFAVYNTEDHRMTSLNEAAMRDLPPAPTCPGPCMECQYLFTLQTGTFYPGDWLIGGLFSASLPGPEQLQPYICGDIRLAYGPQFTMAMMYALHQVNSGQAPVSAGDITFGGFSLDHCSNPGRANLLVSSVYANTLHSMGIEETNILTWMTDRTGATQEAEALLDPLGVAVVSPSATSAGLMDFSNFYRTIQGDHTTAAALVKMVKALEYTYFQVIYSDTSYGREGLESLKNTAQSEGICVSSSVKISSPTAAAADAAVTSMVAAETDVVVFFMGTEDTTAVMEAVLRNVVAKNSLLILMAEPFDSLVSRVSPQLRYKVMSLRLRTGDLQGYKDFINAAPVSNPYFARFYMKLMECNLPGYSIYSRVCPDNLQNITSSNNYVQDNFILATINSVYATVDALDRTVREYCEDSYTTACPRFLTAADWRKRFNKNLANVNFVDEAGNNFRFLSREGNTAYDILQANGQGTYAKVGTFGGVSLVMDDADKDGYKTVQSKCSAPCLGCIMQALNFSHTPGDIYLGGVFDVHESSTSPFTCGNIKTLHGFLLLEAFHYAIDQVNSNTGQFANILPGVKLGGIGLDACGSEIRGGYLVSNINNGYTRLARDGVVVNPEKIDAYVGSYGSRASMYLAEILNDLEIPQISYAAGNPELSDERYYPFFYRTVPSDINMVEAILKFLDKNDIRYVQVLFEGTVNGIETKDYFVKMAPSYSICVAQEVIYPDINTISPETANSVVNDLIEKPAANTVVTFLNAGLINSMLQAILRSDRARNHLRFIGSDDWADNKDAISQTGQQAINSVTVKLDLDDLEGFEEYINQRTLANAEENPWFGEYYQAIHNCYTSKVNTMGYPKPCPLTQSDTINQPNYQQDQGVVYVIDAVYAAAFALHETLKENCGDEYSAVCQAYRSNDDRHKTLRDNLKHVNFTDPFGSEFKFVNRSGSYGYRYYSIDSGVRGVATYKQIGTYSVKDQALDIDPSYKNKVQSNCERKDACAECPLIRDNSVRHVVYKGPNTLPTDATTIVAFFDIHKQGVDPYRCGPINPQGFQQFLAFFYTIEKVLQAKINGIGSQNNGIRVVAIDTCSNSLRVDQDLFGLLAGDGLCNSNNDLMVKLGLGNLGSVVTFGDLNTMAAARVLEAPGVTYLSPNSLSVMLDGKPHLVRTVAPTSAMLQVLVSLIREMGWSYVDMIYEYKAESFYTMEKLVSHSHSVSLCVASSQEISEDDSVQDVETVLAGLSAGSGSKVVILIGSHSFVQRVLTTASSIGIADDYLWVIVGEWEPSHEALSSLSNIARLLTIRRQHWPVNTFSDHVRQLQYGNVHDPNSLTNVPPQWFDEFFQLQLNCTLPNSVRPLGGGRPVCDTTKLLEPGTWTADPYILNTVAAAYASGAGLRDVLSSCNPSCNTGQVLGSAAASRDQIKEKILNVQWNMLDATSSNHFSSNQISAELKFDKTNQWWNQGHILTYWGDDGQQDYTASELSALKDKLSDFSESKCTEEVGNCGCPVSQTAASAQPLSIAKPGFEPEDHRNFYHYDDDDGDKIFEWPLWTLPVAILSCVGALTALILFLVLICAYPVRGGTSVLGYMLILGIVCIYAINFAFFIHATDATCGIRRFLMGVVYMIALAPLLVKAVDNWRFSHVEKAEGRYSGISSACSMLMAAVGLVLIQCIIPIMWLILRHPTASEYIHADGRHDNWWCDPPDDYDLGLVLSFAFVLFVVVVTAGFASASFDSSRNSNESRWIFFSCVATAGCFLVWMVVSTNAGPPYRDPAVAMANFVNATLLMFTMPLRKAVLMCRALKERDEDDVIKQGGNGVIYDYNGTYDNPTYELNDYDNTFMDSKSVEF